MWFVRRSQNGPLNQTGPSRRSCWEAKGREVPSCGPEWFVPHVYRHPEAAGLKVVWLPLEMVFLFQHPPQLQAVILPATIAQRSCFWEDTEWNTYSLAKQGRAGNKNHSAVWNCSVFEEGRGIIYHIMKRHNEKDDKGIVMLNRRKLSCCRVFFYGMQNTLCREANETLLP